MEIEGLLRRTLVSLIICILLLARASSGETITRMMSDDAQTASKATLKVLQAPLHGSAKDYWIAGAIFAGVAASSALDHRVRDAMPHNENGWRKTVDDIGHNYQGPAVMFGTAGALYVAGLAAENRSLRRTGFEIVEAFCIAGAGTQIVKHLAGRNRPFAGHGPFRFDGPAIKNQQNSFPSGDVTVAMALSSVLAAESHSIPISIAVYSLAAMTAYQRLNRDQHWFSDVIGAVAWGSAVGWGVVYWNRKVEPSVNLSLNNSPQIGMTINF
jgi:hypothetical protein